MQLSAILALKDLAIHDSLMDRVLSVIPDEQKQLVRAKIDEGLAAAHKRWFQDHLDAVFGTDADKVRDILQKQDITVGGNKDAV